MLLDEAKDRLSAKCEEINSLRYLVWLLVKLQGGEVTISGFTIAAHYPRDCVLERHNTIDNGWRLVAAKAVADPADAALPTALAPQGEKTT